MDTPSDDLVQKCDQEGSALLPDLPRPEQKAVAAVVCGVAGSQSSVLSVVSTAMPGMAQAPSQQQRAQRLVSNPRLDVARAQRRLLQRVLGQRHGRLDLLLDATTRGVGRKRPGTTTLCLALGWHGRAIPLLWRTWSAHAPGQDWRAAIRGMVAMLQTAVPPDTQVVVLVDRGFSGAPLARLLREVGWHYLWRVIHTTRVRPAGASPAAVREVGTLVSTATGRLVCLSDCHVYAPRRKAQAGAGGWVTDWEQGLTANVVAVWQPGDQAPWIVVTDLPASRTRLREYRRRTWEEELFRDLKGLGWQWQQSRIQQPEHVQRLLLLLALATVWMLALGQRVVRYGWRRLLDARRRRTYSVFQLGLRFWTFHQHHRRSVPVCFAFLSERTASPKLL
jgi:DDE family transposase